MYRTMTNLGMVQHLLPQAQQCLLHPVPMAGTVHGVC